MRPVRRGKAREVNVEGGGGGLEAVVGRADESVTVRGLVHVRERKPEGRREEMMLVVVKRDRWNLFLI